MAYEWTPEADAILREHHALGSSQKVTAQALGGDCQQNDVSRRMKRLGLLARTQKFAAANDETRERLAHERGLLAAQALADAVNLRERIWDTYQVIVSTPTGPVVETLDLPDAKAVSDFANAVNKLALTHENMTRMGAGKATDMAKSMLHKVQNDLAKYAAEYEEKADE